MFPNISLTNISQKKQLIIALFSDIDSSSWNVLVENFDKNIVYERPGYQPLIGLEQVLNFYKNERIIASGKHHIENIIIEGDQGVCWGRFIGLHKNGSQIDERFADVYSFENNKLKTRRTHFFRPAV